MVAVKATLREGALHGVYMETTEAGLPLVTGLYRMGERVGTWVFYREGVFASTRTYDE